MILPNNVQVQLGSDPELWVVEGGKVICADGIIKGTKAKPHPVDMGAIQVDGFAVEYNTDPASTLVQWEYNHRTVQQALLANIGENRVLGYAATAFFDEETFNEAPDEAKILGCEPDYNAWTERTNDTPDNTNMFRTAGGHIHIQFTKDADINCPNHLLDCYALVKALDLWLGIPSVLMDEDNDRRSMYGKAGAFRPKSYGLEYRTLSNFWTKTPQLRAWAFKNTLSSIRWISEKGSFKRLSEAYRRTINVSDKAGARIYTRHYDIPVLEAA